MPSDGEPEVLTPETIEPRLGAMTSSTFCRDGEDALASINARATEISNQKKIAYDVRDSNTEYLLVVTNIKNLSPTLSRQQHNLTKINITTVRGPRSCMVIRVALFRW